MRLKTLAILVVSGMVLLTAMAAANQNNGAAEMMLDAGTKGAVPFPHLKHQENLKDCNICHELFPQAPGSISAFIAQGKLEKKQVMNKLCTKCHKAEKRAGNPSGPTTCTSCHVK